MTWAKRAAAGLAVVPVAVLSLGLGAHGAQNWCTGKWLSSDSGQEPVESEEAPPPHDASEDTSVDDGASLSLFPPGVRCVVSEGHGRTSTWIFPYQW